MRTLTGVFLLTFLIAGLAAPAMADVHGIAYGFVRSVEADFDGAGGCRMVVEQDRINVVDFPAGDLADACAATTPGPFEYIEIIVDDAPLIPCAPWLCSKLSVFSHYTAAGFP